MQIIKKRILILFCILLIVQPVFLVGQADDLFSALERSFNQIENPPTPIDEYYIGRAVAVNILTTYELYTAKPELVKYLNLICRSLAINSSLQAVYNGYNVSILNSQEFNAFATPGGHIFITKGLVEAAPSEDALAGIIAHEMAHITLRHGMKMIDESRFLSELDSVAQQAQAFTGSPNQNIMSFRNSVNDLFNTMITNGYSVSQEFEADTTALALLSAAGYSPNGLLDMLNILQRIQPNQRGGFNNTHPSPTDRITNVRQQINTYRTPDTRSVRVNRFRRNMGIAQ